MRDNREFASLSISALARSRADWLYGINMTRAFTLQGRKVGYQGVLSVGRVQTPLLGLVVARDKEIAHFVAKPYYQVIAHVITQNREQFKARWQPSEDCQPWQDEEGRVVSKKLAENVAARIAQKPASVSRSSRKTKQQPPPLPYNLSSLQIDAAKRFGMSAKAVLDTCQQLYERHKLLTYPRSDSRYLPVEHLNDRDAVMGAIANHSASLAAAVKNADNTLVSKAWNDKRIEAHHAIIPTARKLDASKLSRAECNIYALAARNYVAQFYPAHEYQDSEIELNIQGGVFIARARAALKPGWKQLFNVPDTSKRPSTEAALNTQLPALVKGDTCSCDRGEILDKLTSPPKPFDDASLLAAMTGIARYVTDAAIRKVLKDTDGLGTEATRAGIIELLFSRDFLVREGKKIHATAAGKGLINSLPTMATTPDMTAQWETLLSAISARETSYEAFMLPLQLALTELITQSQAALPQGLSDLPAKKSPFAKRRKKSLTPPRTKNTTTPRSRAKAKSPPTLKPKIPAKG
jgi:DNA topoisomerase-3